MRTDTAIETTHFSQDELTEEVWGPRVTLEPLKKKKNKKRNSKSKSKAKEKEGDMKRYLKMCPTNGYQPRKGEGKGEGAMVKCEVSGSTEFVTSYRVERLVGRGRRRTWVTWSRVVVRREEGGSEEESGEEGSSEDGSGDDEEGGSSEESEKSEEEEEEKGKGAKKGKMGKKGKEVEESSDEEYFDEKRCEWRPKEELKMKKGKDVVEDGKKREKK